MIYEVRSYHYDPDQFAGYKEWAETHAVPYIRANVDLVGFWLADDQAAEIVSDNPADPLGAANISWVIRWQNQAERDERMAQIFDTPQWHKIFALLPGGRAGYLRIQSKMMTAA